MDTYFHTRPDPLRHVLSHTPHFVLSHTQVPLRAAGSAALRNRNARARVLTFSSFNGSLCGQVPEGVIRDSTRVRRAASGSPGKGQARHARRQAPPLDRGVSFAVIDVDSPTRATGVSRGRRASARHASSPLGSGTRRSLVPAHSRSADYRSVSVVAKRTLRSS